MDREEAEQLTNEILDALTCARERFMSFGSQIANKDVIIFLGNTRSGKSTVINYLIGTELHAFLNKYQEYKIEKVDENAYGPSIAQGTLSHTAFPGVYHRNDKSNVVYVDAPGFGDNRGEAQEIINAIFVNQIKHARTCKFVLVCDTSDIRHDNGHDLISSSILRSSISLVITKFDQKWTQTDVSNLLDQQILQCGMPMRQAARELVRQFVEHNERIALFRKPSRKGEITATIDVNIGGAISSCLPLRMNTVPVRCAISDGARLALLEICQNFVGELQFIRELNAGLAEYRNYFVVEDYVFASTEEELDETRIFIYNWKFNLMGARYSNQWNIQKIHDSMIALIQLDASSAFYKTLTLFAMLENVELIQETIRDSLIQKYKNSLEMLVEKINNLINKINVEQRYRKELNIEFNVSVVEAGVTSALAAWGVGGAIQSVTDAIRGTASNTDTLGVFGNLLVAVVGVAGAGRAVRDSVMLYQERDHQIERRRVSRRMQGR